MSAQGEVAEIVSAALPLPVSPSEFRVLEDAVQRLVDRKVAEALAPLRALHAEMGDADMEDMNIVWAWEEMGRALGVEP